MPQPQPDQTVETLVETLLGALVDPSLTWSSRQPPTERPRLAKAAPPPDLVQVNDLAAELAQDQAARLIVGLSDAKRKTVALMVKRGLEQGWSDTVLRARIATVVGLDPRSANAVENYRRGLDSSSLAPAQRARMVDAYAKRLLKARIALIARQETRQVLMDAQRAVWAHQQQIGDLSPYAVRVTRLHKDERLCADCRSQNGRRRSLKSVGGGPPFHPNCRCWEEVEDQGIEKDGPEGSTLYVPDAAVVLGPHPYNRKCKCADCKKERKRRRVQKNEGDTVDNDDMTDAVEKLAHEPLDRSPKKNWVERAGQLPAYIQHIANDLHEERGMPLSRAIAVAISRCKVWAAGGDGVKPDTRAKAAKAVAEWEALKAKNAAKDVSKGNLRKVKTLAGVKFFGAPIGTIITPGMIKAAYDKHGQEAVHAQFEHEDNAPDVTPGTGLVPVSRSGVTREYVAVPEQHGMAGMEERARRQKELRDLRRAALNRNH